MVADHVLLPLASDLRGADERLSRRLDDDAVRGALAAVPDEWLEDEADGARGARDRYARYLRSRLREPRGFVEEAVTARAA
jgi:hypothetical protein